MNTCAPSTPRKACACSVNWVRPRRRLPTAPSPSHTSIRGTPPSPITGSVNRRHQPAYKSSAHREGTSRAVSHREYADTITSTGNPVAVRTCPAPTGRLIGGNQKSHCAISPGS